jgi:hypothetical protein
VKLEEYFLARRMKATDAPTANEVANKAAEGLLEAAGKFDLFVPKTLDVLRFEVIIPRSRLRLNIDECVSETVARVFPC